MSEWQDIATAPRDGTAIWLLLDNQPYIGFGEQTNWLCEHDRFFVSASFRRREPKRDGVADEIYGCHGVDVQPTHWMPLPEPPESQP